ncbi:TraB domain-containing protein [Bienertia sinuspersici]
MNPQHEALCGTIMKLNVEEEKDDTPIPISEDVAKSSSIILNHACVNVNCDDFIDAFDLILNMGRKRRRARANGVAPCVAEEGCDDFVGGQGKVITKEVHWVFGFPYAPKRVPRVVHGRKMEQFVEDLFEKYDVIYKKTMMKYIPMKKVLRVVEGACSADGEEEFKVAFLALYLCDVLCPTTCCRLQSSLLPALTISMEANQYNWCGLMLEKLMDSAWTFARMFEKDEFVKVRLGMFPRVKAWKRGDINKVKWEDLLDGSEDYGHIGLCYVAYGKRHPLQPKDTFGPKSLAAEICPLKIVGSYVVSHMGFRDQPPNKDNCFSECDDDADDEVPWKRRTEREGVQNEIGGEEQVGDGDGIEIEVGGEVQVGDWDGVETEGGGEGQVGDGDDVETVGGGEGQRMGHQLQQEAVACIKILAPTVLLVVGREGPQNKVPLTVGALILDEAGLDPASKSQEDVIILKCGDLCASVSSCYSVISPFPRGVDENYVRVEAALYTRLWRGKYENKSARVMLDPSFAESFIDCDLNGLASKNGQEIYPTCVAKFYVWQCVGMDALLSSVVGSSWVSGKLDSWARMSIKMGEVGSNSNDVDHDEADERTSVEEEGSWLVTDDVTATENEMKEMVKEMVSKYKK